MSHEPASVNGIALHEPGEVLDAQTLRERACTELLRQQAVRAGLLSPATATTAPEPDETTRRAIEALLEAEVHSPEPGAEECRRHYEAHKPRFVVGQAQHVRHILFAVTPGVPVNALAQRAEAALLELSRQGVSIDRFAQLAAELSNCPSSAQGGDLGWITPQDCAPELAKALFLQNDAIQALGLHPRLVHSRFGLHIVEVLERELGVPVVELHTGPYAHAETPDEIGRAYAALSAQQGRDVRLNVIVDPTVVGGVVVRVGEDVIDGSVASRLEQAGRAVSA